MGEKPELAADAGGLSLPLLGAQPATTQMPSAEQIAYMQDVSRRAAMGPPPQGHHWDTLHNTWVPDPAPQAHPQFDAHPTPRQEHPPFDAPPPAAPPG
jgi:hypothetical protein